jgi:uncharacterized protein YeaO (DUF488 family)
MTIRIIRLGSPRVAGEGLRLGTVRRPPRGVRKEDYALRDFYDVWMPELAPSSRLVGQKDWDRLAKGYRREMAAPAADRLLELLARLSHHTNFSVGCYCEDEARCHRSILRELLNDKAAKLA